ncbi:MAG: GNAT family N-acetyltransferase [Pseudomonadota bacterium]
MIIRLAQQADHSAVWSIIKPVIRAGTTYTLDRDLSRDEALAYWFSDDKETFVAEQDGQLLGTYYLRANQGGGGRHVCNCGYITAAHASGQGIARQMCLHSIDHAKTRGFRAMQFNFVVSSNNRAIRLWQSLGFEIVGRLPQAFDHPTEGVVDALIFYKVL